MRPYKTKRSIDENLIRRLQAHKAGVTYIRLLENLEDDCISVQMTDNPANWKKLDGERYSGFKALKRSEIGTAKLSVKFLTPNQIIDSKGRLLGARIPAKECAVVLSTPEINVFILETSLHYKEKILKAVQSIFNMSPYKKIEIIGSAGKAHIAGEAEHSNS